VLIVGINGSCNINGNTKFLLNKVLSKAESLGSKTAVIDVEEVIKDAKVPYCNACSNPCSKVCYEGTKLEEAYILISKADAVVFGSPVYFGTVSAQIKAFFDKTRALRVEKKLYNKYGAALAVGGSKYGGQETTIKALHDMMLVQGMIVVGDGYIEDDCGHQGVAAQRAAENDTPGINRAEILGKRLFELCRKS
jgi:multimeric flavodoxin WrbA